MHQSPPRLIGRPNSVHTASGPGPQANPTKQEPSECFWDGWCTQAQSRTWDLRKSAITMSGLSSCLSISPKLACSPKTGRQHVVHLRALYDAGQARFCPLTRVSRPASLGPRASKTAQLCGPRACQASVFIVRLFFFVPASTVLEEVVHNRCAIPPSPRCQLRVSSA